MSILSRIWYDKIEKKTLTASKNGTSLPGYLVYPTDPIAAKMLEGDVAPIVNKECCYMFKLYTAISDTTPGIQKLGQFDIHEMHIYCKSGSPSWITVTTMKSPSVRTSSLKNWVEAYRIFGADEWALNMPVQWEIMNFDEKSFMYLGQEKEFNKFHDFDETHCYFQSFEVTRDNEPCLYKKFILCAKKDQYSWKVECNITAKSPLLDSTDFVSPGMTFGSFFPKV